MRVVILFSLSCAFILLSSLPADASELNTGIGLMLGYSLAKDNDAVEDFSVGLKYRLDQWEAEFDLFRSKFANGGFDKMGVLSIDYTWDFARIEEENYGIYAGTGLSWLGAADVWDDGPAWNLLVGYDYTSSVSLSGRFFYTLNGGEMFAVGGFTYLFF